MNDHTTSTTLSIDQIRIDGGTQPRVKINKEHVADLAAALVAGTELPPVDVFHDGSDYWLADGFHRYHAHARAARRGLAGAKPPSRNGLAAGVGG